MNIPSKRLSVVAVIVFSLYGAYLNAQAPHEPETTAAADTSKPAVAAHVSPSASVADPPRTTPNTTAGVTINGRYFPPLMTGKERWDNYVKDTFTTFPIYAASFGAALGDQASNTPKPWERNFGGYAKRAGSEYAAFAIQTSIYQGGSALLHNEGRYVACQCGGGWHRAGYALEMSFFAYHNQKKMIDVPQIVGAYAGGIIPVTWYPKGYSVSAQGVQNGTYQLGFVVLVREIQEFGPELKHFFRHFKP